MDYTELQPSYWLTVFEEESGERPDHDVTFATAEGEELLPPPIIVRGHPIAIPVPLELILPAGLFWFVRRKLQRRRANAPS